MKKPLKLLIVDDSINDSELIVCEIKKGGYEPTWIRVNNSPDFDYAIEKGIWDVVISDYKMLSFDGISALEKLRYNNLDIPFILVSGSVGEETAVFAMKSGANDYIMKNNLTRLVSAIDRELKEADIRKKQKSAEEQLKQKTYEVSQLYKASMKLSYSLDLNSICKSTYEIVKDVIECDGFIISTYNPVDNLIICNHMVHYGILLDTFSIPPVSFNPESLSKQSNVVKLGRSLLASDFDSAIKKNWMQFFVNDSGDKINVVSPEKDLENSVINVPLLFRNNIVGVIQVLCKKINAFNENQVGFLEAIAPLVAAAIENAMLYKQAQNEISERKKAEDKYRLLFESIPVPVLIYNVESLQILSVNDTSINLYGYSKEEFLKLTIKDISPQEEIPRSMNILSSVNEGSTYFGEWKHVKKNGTIMIVEGNCYSLIDDSGKKQVLLIQDITNRKMIEDALIANESKYRTLVEGISEGLISSDNDDIIIFVNKQMCDMIGYSQDELVGKKGYELLIEPAEQEFIKKKMKQREKGVKDQYEIRMKHKSGKLKWLSVGGSPVYDNKGIIIGSIGVFSDIEEKKQKDELLLKSLKEKEIMLREINHRVNNNLQIISSLLKLQSEYIKDSAVCEHLQVSQNRIKTMALIYQQLYKSENLDKINFKNYISTLSKDLLSVYNLQNKNVDFNIRSKNIFLNIDTAIPCGLLINELLSNCFKHAFRGRRKGKINIELLLDNGNKYILIVRDNGIGVFDDFNFDTPSSFGIELIKSLTEQLDGTLQINRNSGTEIKVNFSEINYTRRL